MTKSKKIMIGALPFAALIVLFAVFCGIVSSKGYRLDMYIKIIFNEGIVLSIVATGAIFIYTLGSFDISLGAATLFSATLGVMTYNATENFILMIVVILLSGIVCSLLNSVLASIFHIPVFVTTVAMMSVLSAIASQIITTKGGAVGGISIPSEVVKHLDTSAFKIIVLVIWVVVCAFIFDYTKFGRREKFVGGNPICAQLSGIKYICNTWIPSGGNRRWNRRIYDAGLYPICYNNDSGGYRDEHYGCYRVWRYANLRRCKIENLCGCSRWIFLYYFK